MRALILETPDKHDVDVYEYGEAVLLFPEGLTGSDFRSMPRLTARIVDRLDSLGYDSSTDYLVLAGSKLACIALMWAACQTEDTVRALAYVGGQYQPVEFTPDSREVESDA